MRRNLFRLVIVAAVAASIGHSIHAGQPDTNIKTRIYPQGTAVAASNGAGCYGTFSTPELIAELHAFGSFSNRAPRNDPCQNGCGAEAGCYGLESPPGSGINYLFGGGFWIGGVVGTDTICSMSYAGWLSTDDFVPDPGPDGNFVGLLSNASPADSSYRTVLVDTGGSAPNALTPLLVKVTLRSHSWQHAPANQVVVYDMLVRSINPNPIEDAYVGVIVDADVGIYDFGDEFLDDITGSIRSEGIGYAIDNDGDPEWGQFGASSCRRVFATKFLNSSFTPLDTNFNWWKSHFDTTLDYGPQMNDSLLRSFAMGGYGTPTLDEDMYFLLSRKEWDYDQVLARHLDSISEPWLPPPAILRNDLSDGSDSKFMLSIGPFDLAPDSTVRVIFALMIGKQVHQDPLIMDFLPLYPNFYRWSLNFGDLINVAHAAEGLADSLLSARAPVSGLQITVNGDGTAVASWDPYVFSGLDGYELYLTEVDSALLPYPGTMAPWLQPDSLVPWQTIPVVSRYAIDTALNSERFYFANVAQTRADTIGDPGAAAVFRPVDRAPAPEPETEVVFFAGGQTVQIPFNDPSENTDHYNVYLLPSFGDTTALHHPFYDLGDATDSLVAADSLEVDGTTWYYYAMARAFTVDGSDSVVVIPAPADSSIVVISSVSPGGFESAFSHPVRLLQAPARTRDVLVMTRSSASNFQAVPDSIRSFYETMLAGLDYDIFYLADSGSYTRDWAWWYTLAPYRLVIIDDDLADKALLLASLTQMENYLSSGGHLLVCGSLYEVSGAAYVSRTHGWHYADTVAHRLLGIDSVYSIGLRFYRDSTAAPYVDSLGGFVEASPVSAELPFLSLNTARDPYTSFIHTYWPDNTAPLAVALVPDSGTEPVYMYGSLYPGTSEAHGYPVAVSRSHGAGKVTTAGFHLWYLEPAAVRTWIDELLEQIPTSVEPDEQAALPDRFTLAQNYPNPFNPTTTIEFSLAAAGRVELEIFNILGQRVTAVVDGPLPAGRYTVEWDGAEYSSGVYFYRLRTADGVLSRKMLLLK